MNAVQEFRRRFNSNAANRVCAPRAHSWYPLMTKRVLRSCIKVQGWFVNRFDQQIGSRQHRVQIQHPDQQSGFVHHRNLAVLPSPLQDRLLKRCVETNGTKALRMVDQFTRREG